MKEFQDMYEATDNLGQPRVHPGDGYHYLCLSKQILLSQLFFFWRLSSELQWQHIKGRRAGDMMVKQTFSLPLILGLLWTVCLVILVALSLHLHTSLFSSTDFWSLQIYLYQMIAQMVTCDTFLYIKKEICAQSGFITNVWWTKNKY